MAASDALRAHAGIPAAAREYLHRSGTFPSAAERSWLAGARHHLVPFTDPNYPKLLRSLPGCPIALYVAGNIEALGDPQLAVVGSRNPTPQGRDTAFEFAQSIWRSAGSQSPAGWRRASIPRRTAALWRRRESPSPCWEAGSMWSIPAATGA